MKTLRCPHCGSDNTQKIVAIVSEGTWSEQGASTTHSTSTQRTPSTTFEVRDRFNNPFDRPIATGKISGSDVSTNTTNSTHSHSSGSTKLADLFENFVIVQFPSPPPQFDYSDMTYRVEKAEKNFRYSYFVTIVCVLVTIYSFYKYITQWDLGRSDDLLVYIFLLIASSGTTFYNKFVMKKSSNLTEGEFRKLGKVQLANDFYNRRVHALHKLHRAGERYKDNLIYCYRCHYVFDPISGDVVEAEGWRELLLSKLRKEIAELPTK